MDTVHECDRRTDRQTDGQNYDHKDFADDDDDDDDDDGSVA